MSEKKKITRAQAEALMLKLSWEILEHKWCYYVGKAQSSKVHPIPDAQYDKIEKVYERCCKLLGLNATASEVGFSFQKASRQIVHYKMCEKYGLDPIDSMKVF